MHLSLTNWLNKLDIFGENQGHYPFELNDTLEHLRHLLPNQGPIKDFIHHNPIHGFQSMEFHKGIALASSLFGSKSYLSIATYESRFKSEEITEAHIDFEAPKGTTQRYGFTFGGRSPKVKPYLWVL